MRQLHFVVRVPGAQVVPSKLSGEAGALRCQPVLVLVPLLGVRRLLKAGRQHVAHHDFPGNLVRGTKQVAADFESLLAVQQRLLVNELHIWFFQYNGPWKHLGCATTTTRHLFFFFLL